MVNYRYDHAQTQRRHQNFAFNGVVVATKPVAALSTATLSAMPKEKPS